MMVQGIRLAIVKEVEGQQETPVDADLEQRDGTSREALSKFEDYCELCPIWLVLFFFTD